MLKYYGIHQPQICTSSGIYKFLTKKNAQNVLSFACRDTVEHNKFMSKISFPEAHFFDGSGFYISYKPSSKICNSGVDSFIYELKHQKGNSDTSFNINYILLGKVNLENHKEYNLTNLPKSDFFVVLIYTEYLGKLNDIKTFNWLANIDKVNQNHEIQITPIMISADYFDFWGISKNYIPEFDY